MRFFRPPPALVVAAALAAAPLGLVAQFKFFSSTWGDVIIATDMTTEGKALTPPSREQPVYFLGTSLGCRFGSIPGDQLPEVREMNQFIAKVLAQQGYLAARTGHEPTLFVVAQWGYLQPQSGDLLWFLGYDARQDIGAPTFPGTLGPEVFRRNLRSHAVETVLDSASGPIYGIILTAFEYHSARTDKPVIYWQTRIGLPAQGKSMEQALPAMMLAAGPSIGRESTGPVLRSADTARDGHVKLRDLEFIEFEPTPASEAARRTERD